MKYTMSILLAIAALFIFSPLAAQEQPQKSPEEMAIEEADRLEKELMLNGSQLFYVDSVLRANFLGLQEDMETLRGRGSEDYDSYNTVREKWIQKTIDSFKGILDEQQYIRYLRYLGKGKEYKKGKDGKFYLKEELKKKKKN